MENLRWILIFAGVAILVLLWVSGRSARRDSAASRDADDPLLARDSLDDDFGHIDLDDMARPGTPVGAGARASQAGGGPFVPAGAAARASEGHAGRDRSYAAEGEHGGGEHAGEPSQGLGALTRKIEAFGEKLAPNRRRRVLESEVESRDDPEETAPKPYASKIVTLHVVAPAGEILPPEALYEMFGRRGYHHGHMDIFHSLHDGKTVFSVARMVKPGTFDLDDLATFETPGLALILQLPGPVAADTAFEVMLTEAFEIADELGGAVLDGNRSTLSRQTEQHLRESIHEYMHRQKYFDSVA